MSRQRRIRDAKTGRSVYYDIDTKGAGVFDAIKNVASSITSKLPGEAAKKIAEKAAEKVVEKGAEKVGEKTGQLLGEKIYDRFSSKASLENPQGDQIIKEVQKEFQKLKAEEKHRKKPEKQSLSKAEQSLSKASKKQGLTLSQQFDELLQKM